MIILYDVQTKIKLLKIKDHFKKNKDTKLSFAISFYKLDYDSMIIIL